MFIEVRIDQRDRQAAALRQQPRDDRARRARADDGAVAAHVSCGHGYARGSILCCHEGIGH